MRKKKKGKCIDHLGKIRLIDIVLLCLLVGLCWGDDAQNIIKESGIADPEGGIRETVGYAIASIKPALVKIHAVKVSYLQGREVKREISGSGVIISNDGYVVTNHHVAGRAKQIFCTLSDREELKAELVGSDPLTDVAVIKLLPEREYPFARFGNSDSVEVGDYILAMGSPMALSQSVTMGIVSNTKLVMPKLLWPFNKVIMEGENVGSIVRWIGHDAAIYPGNSGGPLVNMEGEVVGVNEIRFGISGAIPGNLVQSIIEELIESGDVVRSWLGLEVQPLLSGSKYEQGVLISDVIKGTPAEKAAFMPGDILIEIAGRKVNVRFAEQLPVFNKWVMGLPIGKEIEAIVLRDGRKIRLDVRPERREYIQHKTVEFKQWGITARNLSFLSAREMKRKNKDGVLVTSIRPGGPCGNASPRIIPEDVIVKIGRKPINNIEQLTRLTRKITRNKEEPVPVIVTFERKKKQFLTVVKVGIKELEDPGLEVRKAWLPVSMQVLTREIAVQLGISGQTGMRVTQVYKNSTAEQAGIKVGDIIIGLDGESILASEPEDFELLPAMIRRYKIGSLVTLTIIRGKREFDLNVELVQAPKLPREMKKYRDENFEFTVRDVAFQDRAQEGWQKKKKGVLVEEVNRGGWAALAKLAVGDLIISLNGEPVFDTESFRDLIEEVHQKRPDTVVFQVLRGIHNLYIEIKPDWSSLD